MTRIAINYRRDDTSPWAGRLYDRLGAEFGREHVFMDIDTLEPGADFVEEINKAVGESHVLVAVIGPDWATIRDPKGNRRLDNPMDFVRMEIVAALTHNIRIIPVLVGGAVMPVPAELPDDLAILARRHAIEISDLRFHADVDRLIRSIKLVLERLERSAARASGSRGLAPPSPTPPPTEPKPPSLPAEPPMKRVTAEAGAPDRPAPPPQPGAKPGPPVSPPAHAPGAGTRMVLNDLMGAGAPASRSWKHWLLLTATFWVAWSAWPVLIGQAGFPEDWRLLMSVVSPAAFVFSAVYSLSVLRSQTRAIVTAGLINAAIASAYAPALRPGVPGSITANWAFVMVLLLAIMAVTIRRQWRVWLALVVAVSAAAALVEYYQFSRMMPPDYARLWRQDALNRAMWPILLLGALAILVPRFRTPSRGIVLSVAAASLLDWLSWRVLYGGGAWPNVAVTAGQVAIVSAGVWLGSRRVAKHDRHDVASAVATAAPTRRSHPI